MTKEEDKVNEQFNAKKIMRDCNTLRKTIKNFSNGQAAVTEWDDDKVGHFEVTISPNGGPYKDGEFKFKIAAGQDYPQSPPRVQCKTAIYHPNIDTIDDPEGEICFSLFDDMSVWTSDATFEDVVQGLLFLMYYPNTEDPLNVHICAGISEEEFEENVRISLAGGLVDDTFLYPPNEGYARKNPILKINIPDIDNINDEDAENKNDEGSGENDENENVENNEKNEEEKEEDAIKNTDDNTPINDKEEIEEGATKYTDDNTPIKWEDINEESQLESGEVKADDSNCKESANNFKDVMEGNEDIHDKNDDMKVASNDLEQKNKEERSGDEVNDDMDIRCPENNSENNAFNCKTFDNVNLTENVNIVPVNCTKDLTHEATSTEINDVAHVNITIDADDHDSNINAPDMKYEMSAGREHITNNAKNLNEKATVTEKLMNETDIFQEQLTRWLQISENSQEANLPPVCVQENWYIDFQNADSASNSATESIADEVDGVENLQSDSNSAQFVRLTFEEVQNELDAKLKNVKKEEIEECWFGIRCVRTDDDDDDYNEEEDEEECECDYVVELEDDDVDEKKEDDHENSECNSGEIKNNDGDVEGTDIDAIYNEEYVSDSEIDSIIDDMDNENFYMDKVPLAEANIGKWVEVMYGSCSKQSQNLVDQSHVFSRFYCATNIRTFRRIFI